MLSCFFGASPSAAFIFISSCASNPLPKMPWGWGKSTKDSRKGGCKDVDDDGAGSPRGHLTASGTKRAGNNKGETDTASTRGQHRLSLDGTQQNSDPRSVFAINTLISRSPSPSTPSTRCPSFSDKKPPAQPLPLPAPLGKTLSGNGLPVVPLSAGNRFFQSPSIPVHPETAEHRILAYEPSEIDLGLGTSGAASEHCSNSSVSSLGSVEVIDSWNHAVSMSRLRPCHDNDAPEQGRHPVAVSSSLKHHRKNSNKDLPPSSSPRPAGHTPSTSPSKGYSDQKRTLSPIRLEPGGLRIQPLNGSAPDSSLSSPARSPKRGSTEHVAYGGFWTRQEGLSSSAQGSSPGSGPNSGHNSSGGDAAQLLRGSNNPSRRSPEPSPIPSPRQRSPGVSGTVSPLHPRYSGTGSGGSEIPTRWHEDGQTSAHPLPLPPPRVPTPPGGSPTHYSPPISPAPSPTPSSTTGRPYRSDSFGNFPTRWQKGKCIGSGTFGNVYVGFNSDSGALCAMKEVLLVSDDSKSKESVKQLGQEIAVLSRLRHPNIVQYIGTEALEDRLCIYLEYVSGGSIHKLLQEYGLFKEPVIRSFTRQILCGLAYLHNMNTVHRDVKGANILVDTNGKVKLADFGMAKHITAQSFPLSFKGSPYWMAPEVIKHTNGYDLAVDIWSLGCTVLEMATAKPPWHQYEGVAAMFKIGNSKELPNIPDSLSPEGKDFVRACLQRDPNKRPTAQQLLEHPFVKNLQDDRFDDPDDVVTASAGIQNLNFGNRHDIDVGIAFPPLLSRTRGQISPTSSDLTRTSSGYLPSNPNSLSPTGQSRRHVYNGNGLSSLPHSPRVGSGGSTPHTGGYGSPHSSSHGSTHGSAHGVSHTHPYANGTYGAIPSPYPDPYSNVPRPNGVYGNGLMNGGYAEPVRSEFHWGTPHRTPEGSPLRRDLPPQENDILGMALGRVSQDREDTRRQFNVNGNLVEHVSQQLLRRPKQPSPVLYHHRASLSPALSRTDSELSH